MLLIEKNMLCQYHEKKWKKRKKELEKEMIKYWKDEQTDI